MHIFTHFVNGREQRCINPYNCKLTDYARNPVSKEVEFTVGPVAARYVGPEAPFIALGLFVGLGLLAGAVVASLFSS